MQGSSNISGLTSGNLVITHKGTLSIASHMSGTVHLTFKEPGMFSGLSSKKASKHQVSFAVSRLPLPGTKSAFFWASWGLLSFEPLPETPSHPCADDRICGARWREAVSTYHQWQL